MGCIIFFVLAEVMELNKEDIINEAKLYSKDAVNQRAYIAGFQSACNIVREKINTCYNEEFCNEMEELSSVSYMEFDNL